MASFVYEALMLFGIGLIPGAAGALLVALGHPQQLALRVLAVAVYGAYFIGYWSMRGQTLPMQTWHIRVVTAQGAPLSWQRASCRYLASYVWLAPAACLAQAEHWTRWQALGAVVVGIVVYALLALLHPQRQFWHDALCGTRLIYVGQNRAHYDQ